MTDFQIRQGTDSGILWPVYSTPVPPATTGLPVNFTGYSGRGQIRTSSGKLLHQFTTALGNMVLTGDGKVILKWTAAETAGWKWNQGVYDVEIIAPDGKVSRLKQGVVTLSKEVTI